MTQRYDPFGEGGWGNVLADVPQTAFFSFQDQFGKSPRQRRYFQNQFQQFHNQFLGALGQQIRSGETNQQGVPPLLMNEGFTNWLRDMPFTERFASMTPSERGSYSAPYAPRTRWLPF